MKHKKKVLVIGGSVLGALAIGLGIFAGAANSGKKPVYVYPFDIVGMTDYWGDSQESYGPVRSDNIQTVMLSDTQTVTEINVKVGDTVKKDDVLMSYDSTLSDLALEKKRLKVEQLKLQLQQEKDRLAEINNLQPYTPQQGGSTYIPPDVSGDDAFQSGETYLPNTTYTDVTTWSGGSGSSKDDPVILWVRQDGSVSANMVRDVAAFLEEARYRSAKAEYDSAYKAYLEAKKAYDDAVAAGEDPGEAPVAPTLPERESITNFYMVLKEAYGDHTKAYAYVYFGMHVYLTDSGYYFTPFDASNVNDYTKDAVDYGGTVVDEPDVPEGTVYTLAEIVKMREDQQKTILDVEYNIKVAEAEYRIAQRETTDGKVRSEVDGKVVSVLTEEEARETKQPIIKVSGGGGYYVVGSVSELVRDRLAIGSEVTINDYRNGNMYTGTVESIGDYPTDNGYGNGNQNVSYYPFNVFVDESADLVGGSYVNISYSLNDDEGGIYLANAFIRKENGENIVYVQGPNGKLEKRTVVTGKTVWGSYKEILSGITTEDKVAFPYGKNVKVGASTELGDYSTLYGN